MNFFKKFNNLDLSKKEDKKILISFSVSLLGILMLLTGTSAAYLSFRNQGTEINTITSGNITMTLSQESSSIMLSNAMPKADVAGIELSNYYSFTIQSSSSIYTYYEIKLINECVINTSVTVNGTTITPDVCIPNQYVKVAISRNDGDYEVKSIGENGVIYSGYVSNKEQDINFKLKIWLSENTPNTYQGKTTQGIEQDVVYLGKMQLYGRQTIEEEVELTNIDKSGANKPE